MIDEVVKVGGTVIDFRQDPGGFHLRLEGGGGQVGVRIESAIWQTLTEEDKTQFEKGKMATAEGILVLTGDGELFVILGVIPTQAATSTPTPTPSPTPAPGPSPTSSPPQPEPGKTTFTVKTPANTPDYSTIYMEWFYSPESISEVIWSNVEYMIEMEKVSANTWKAEIVVSAEGHIDDGVYFCYRYSRDKWGYPAAEEFTPDSENTYRKITIKESAGKAITDTVEKWRWFSHPDDPPLPILTSSAQTTTIKPRIQGEKLRRGVGLQDFWSGFYGDVLIESTHKALKADYINTVALGGPVWGYTKLDPLPVISESPFYPTADLKTHLARLKKDGFNVLVNAQFGNYSGDPEMDSQVPHAQPHSQEWWDTWYQEVERAVLYSADIAEMYEAEMFIPFGGLTSACQGEHGAPNSEEKFSELIDKVRQRYSGKIVTGMVIGLKPPEWQDALPLPEEIPAFEKFDVITLGIIAALTRSESPTQIELNSNATKLFEEKVESLYKRYQKPIILGQLMYSSYEGVLQNAAKYTEEETLLWAPYNPAAVFSSTEQAMAYEAIMSAVAEADYIIGTYPFGYHVVDFPRHVGLDIRGKQAEQILAGWYKRFLEEGK
ncbi:hypothetical protein ACFLVB_01730 [Chloroflexota bacterium]